ncbi:hypothetical protein amb2721 [Paramagnetospirillum magneticum AMB-1]|uniref:DNA-directed DNA polymerase family A palm domain-containing protein n=1 Tax=Paramagnetospirillum magneticum (strain ATCC 700264 / AMB-1) TaxID=342108 RepID=Q2W3Q0_PARM1|nr:hypothetical protein amb2721 [Paramagnetospirillum magneticum AMB-1]
MSDRREALNLVSSALTASGPLTLANACNAATTAGPSMAAGASATGSGWASTGASAAMSLSGSGAKSASATGSGAGSAAFLARVFLAGASKVTKATKAADLTTWLRDQGVETEGVAKAAVRQMLAGDIEGAARQAVEIRAEAAKASTAKLTAMVKCACDDGRARGLHLVYGAGTGRWAGRLIQLQNLPRGVIKKADLAIPLIIDGDIDLVSMLFGPPLDVISSNLRGCLIPAEGCDFIQSDFSNIEGRITAWLANEEWKIQAFRDFDAGTGRDLYLIGAEKILTLLKVLYAHPLNENSPERTPYGKVPELALGFGGGVGAFQSMAAIYGMKVTDEEADQIKVAWREAHPRVVALWRNMEDAAFNAISNPGRVVSTAGGRIKYVVKGGFLWMVLPSGRPLAYAHPRIEKRRPAWNIGQDEIKLKDTITFMAVNSITRKWERCTTYGGSLAENAIQAIARDLLANALLKLEAAGYPVVIHVHDEALAEVRKGVGSVDEFKSIMCDTPAWAAGLPVAAAGWRGSRYRK